MLCMTPDRVVIQVTIKDWLKCRGELNGQAQNPMIGITGCVLHYLMSLVLFDYSQNTALPRSKDGCCVEDVRVSTKIVRLAGGRHIPVKESVPADCVTEQTHSHFHA